MNEIMRDIVNEFLNEVFYYCAVNRCVYSVDNEKHKLGYAQVQNIVSNTFQVNEDWAHAIVFNWLLTQDVPLVLKDWNKSYITHNVSVIEYENRSMTEEVDFIYKLIPEDPTKKMTLTL